MALSIRFENACWTRWVSAQTTASPWTMKRMRCCRLLTEVVADVVDELAQVDAAKIEREIAGLDAAQLRQVVDQTLQPAQLPRHDPAKVMVVFLGEVSGVRFECFHGGSQACERCAYLMGKIGDEVTADLFQPFDCGHVDEQRHRRDF